MPVHAYNTIPHDIPRRRHNFRDHRAVQRASIEKNRFLIVVCRCIKCLSQACNGYLNDEALVPLIPHPLPQPSLAAHLRLPSHAQHIKNTREVQSISACGCRCWNDFSTPSYHVAVDAKRFSHLSVCNTVIRNRPRLFHVPNFKDKLFCNFVSKDLAEHSKRQLYLHKWTRNHFRSKNMATHRKRFKKKRNPVEVKIVPRYIHVVKVTANGKTTTLC